MPVKAIGADLVTKAFESMRLDLPNVQGRFLTQISKSTLDLLRANTPKDTGILSNSWYEISRTSNSVIIGVKDDQTKKLKYIIFGTRPHEIRARNFKTLKFEYPKGSGIFVYPQSVQHPGTEPNNFIASVLYTISLNIEAVMSRILRESHPYYRNLPLGTYYGFGSSMMPKGKASRTSADIVGLTGLRFFRRRGRGRSYISPITLKGKKLTRRVGVGRRRT